MTSNSGRLWLTVWMVAIAFAANAVSQPAHPDEATEPRADIEHPAETRELKHTGGRAYRGIIVGDTSRQNLVIVSMPDDADGNSYAVLHLFGDTDSGAIDWRSESFPYCTAGDCEHLPAPDIVDLNGDGAYDIFLSNWVTGMGGHWANVAWIFDDSAGTFQPAYFQWQPEAVSDLGSTFESRRDTDIYGDAPCEQCVRALWQATFDDGLICSSWSVYGQYIDQIHLNAHGEGRYIESYNICFGHASGAVFEIRRIDEYSCQTSGYDRETGYDCHSEGRRVVFPREEATE